MASVIGQQIAEFEAEIARREPQIAGLQKLARLNEGEPSGAHVQGLLTRAVRELDQIRTQLSGSRALVASGYPSDLLREVPPEILAQDILADLIGDSAAVAGAVRLFRGPELAKSLNLSGSAEPR